MWKFLRFSLIFLFFPSGRAMMKTFRVWWTGEKNKKSANCLRMYYFGYQSRLNFLFHREKSLPQAFLSDRVGFLGISINIPLRSLKCSIKVHKLELDIVPISLLSETDLWTDGSVTKRGKNFNFECKCAFFCSRHSIWQFNWQWLEEFNARPLRGKEKWTLTSFASSRFS